MIKKKLIRITTVPISLEKLLSGQLNFMKSFYDVIAISSEKANLLKYGESESLETFHVEMTRKITPFKDFLAMVKLYFYFKKQKPFIVHTHTPKAGLVGMIAAKLARVPNRLHTVAGLPLLETIGLKRKILNFVERLTYFCATKVYPNSYGLSDIILSNKFCSPSKIKILANGSSNGIDTTYFDSIHFNNDFKTNLKNEYEIQENDFVFIFVGRIVADKGINELIEAFSDISILYSNVKLLLVGPFEQELNALNFETMETIKNNKNIIHTGYQNDVRPYFAISDCLIFPSYREGFPNVVMQAGAMNLPCIVTNINGCNEIIIQKKNGIIIPVKDKIAIFEAMKDIFLNNDFKNLLKNNARLMITSRYEQKLVWESILKEYNALN